VRLVRSASIVASIVGAIACQSAPASPVAQRMTPTTTCGGRMGVTEIPSNWESFAVVAESHDSIDVPERSDPDDGIAVKDIAVDHFLVRVARQRGSLVGPLQVLERDCRDAPLSTKIQWAGDAVTLHRRGDQYVVAWSMADAGTESAIVAFVWMPARALR
jgi:hypothetical protein